MPCPFYGRAASRLLKITTPTGGNQCALIFEGHAPCRMEMEGFSPELEHCDFNGSGRAVEVATYERHQDAPGSDHSPYTDQFS